MPDSGKCPSEGNFAIAGDCFRFYKCIRSSYNGNIGSVLLKCPSGFAFIETRCVRGYKFCPQEKLGQERGYGYYEGPMASKIGLDTGMPVPLHLYSQLVEF